MRVPKLLALLIGIATLWPVVYIFIFMSFALTSLFSAAAQSDPSRMESSFQYLFVAHLGTMLLMLGLLVFCIVHVFKNTAFKDDRRVLWALVLFMGGPLSMPVYWWLHIWHAPDTVAARE